MVFLSEIKVPKNLLKKKKIPFIKAFLLKDGDEMKVNADIDIFAFTYEAAVQYMINSMNIEDIENLKGKTINFITFNILKDDLLTIPLTDHGEVYNENDNVSLTLENKPYEISLEDKTIENIEFEIGERNEIKIITSPTFVEE